MKKKIAAVIALMLLICITATGCAEADQVSYNISKEADNFNVTRKLTVLNARTDTILLELTGTFALKNNSDNELEVIIETADNKYQKDYVYLNGDGTTTVSAALYKAGREVTKEYPAAWFSWSRRTEQGEAFLQYGYSVTVNNDDYMFGGVVIGQFIRYVQMALTVGDKLLVIGNKAMCVNVDA